MVRTCVGYTGGTTSNPTYRNMGDHSEALQVEFDPDHISYSELLEVFWSNHNPRARSWSAQYRNALYVHSPEQETFAQISLEALSDNGRRAIRTPIQKVGPFYPAEDYHQKYYLRHQRELWAYFTKVYPNHADIVRSTAAARINGLLRGHGVPTEGTLQALLPQRLHGVFIPA